MYLIDKQKRYLLGLTLAWFVMYLHKTSDHIRFKCFDPGLIFWLNISSSLILDGFCWSSNEIGSSKYNNTTFGIRLDLMRPEVILFMWCEKSAKSITQWFIDWWYYLDKEVYI